MVSKIGSMEAGRELDALVAEKVMGLKNIREEEGLFGTMTLYGEQEIPGEFGRLTAKGLPRYSTDIAAAWGVVEKIRSTKLGCFFLNWDRISDMWAAGFDGNVGKYEIQQEIAPHAICLAALKAIGQEST